MRYIGILAVFFALSSTLFGQNQGGINADLREMNKLDDPAKAVMLKQQIIKKYSLDSTKNAEIFDIINGSVAMVYARNNDHNNFDHYTGLMKNKFNQTSMMNMAATELLNKKLNDTLALSIAKETIEKYKAYKNDPSAMPPSFKPEDWKRFMAFAQYPYYDTYAHALYATGNYKDALTYQEMAFAGKPEDGIPPAVERYAQLLALNGKKDDAKNLLMKVAAQGKLTQDMANLLQTFYKEGGRKDKTYDQFLDSLQARVKENMKTEFRKTMLNTPAPDFTIKNLKGKKVSLSDYKGKIVVLDLWATWCGPCIASFPAMQMLVNKYTDVEFLFIAVQEGGNAAARVKNFLAKHNYTFNVLLDEPLKKGADETKVLSAYRPDGIPAKYFIDKKGMLQFATKGFDTDAQLVNETELMIEIMNETEGK